MIAHDAAWREFIGLKVRATRCALTSPL
jgi:hypothetical protein